MANVQHIDVPKLRRSRLCIAGSRLSIRIPRLRDCRDLHRILCTDKELIQLGIGGAVGPSCRGVSFRDKTNVWCEKTNSVCLAIIDREDKAVGLISLSHIDESMRTGMIGYWIGSDYWRRGYGTEALALVLSLARKLGLRSVSASIRKDNIPSLKMWSRYNAAVDELPDNMVECTINLVEDDTGSMI